MLVRRKNESWTTDGWKPIDDLGKGEYLNMFQII